MKSYDLLLFDWDGCIAETLDLVLKSYKETFAEYDTYPEDSYIAKEIFGSWESPRKVGIEDIESFTEKYKVRVENDYLSVPMTEGAIDVLKYFKQQRKKMVLVTTSHLESITPLLEKHQLSNFFDEFITAEKVTKHKPDPESVYKAIDLMKGKKESTIIIGDSTSDLGAAQNAGIDSVLYYPKQHEKFYSIEDLKKYNPTYIISQFSELIRTIE